MLATVSTLVHAQSVVQLPGVKATAGAPNCTEPARGRSVELSYACLNQLVSDTATPKTLVPADTDVSHRPTNTLGLYNAASLQHRMGPNLGNSVQPYRPRVSYPNPLVPAH